MTPPASAIAAVGLRTQHELPDEPLDRSAFEELLRDCTQHRLLGLLARAVRTGALPVDAEQHRAVESSVLGWLGHALRVERLLLGTTSALDRAGIESRVLKGVALAHTAYDDPADRVFGDADLLVPGREFTHAVQALEATFGVERAQPEIRPGFDDRFGKEATLTVGGVELDLHRTFVEGALGLTVGLDDLFAPPYRFPLGVTELEALPMPPRFLHACYAAALGDWPPRLISLRDVAQILLRERPHPADVLFMARSWRCEVVVARAITTTWRELALSEPPRSSAARVARRTGPGLHAAPCCPGRAPRRRTAARVPPRHRAAPARVPRSAGSEHGFERQACAQERVPVTDPYATRYRRRPDVLWRGSLDAVVLLPAGQTEPITLGGSGPELWELLAEWRAFDDLVAVLAGLHAADAAIVARDVAPVLEQLVGAGAVDGAARQEGH